MAPRIVPLLYVQKGRFVVPDGAGGWRPGPDGSDVERARKLFAAHDALYVFDLDAQTSGASNVEFYQTLEKRHVFPWLDVGARRPEDVMDAFFAGAEAITVQLRHMPPDLLEEVGGMAEADFHVGLTLERGGLEKGLAVRDVEELVGRVGATGVVLYEGVDADVSIAAAVADELKKAGVPTAWVERPGSVQAARAEASGSFAVVVRPEAAA